MGYCLVVWCLGLGFGIWVLGLVWCVLVIGDYLIGFLFLFIIT